MRAAMCAQRRGKDGGRPREKAARERGKKDERRRTGRVRKEKARVLMR